MSDLGLKSTLWRHQREAAKFAWPREGTLLAMDLGTGKSLTAIALAQAWHARRVLIVCPLSVVGVWPRELSAHSLLDWQVARCDRGGARFKSELAQKTLAKADIYGDPCAVIVNHESVWRRPFKEVAFTAGFDLLVVDECHRAKAPGGKLSRFLGQLAKHIPRRLGLTGTPLPHSLLDAYAQARFLDRRVFGTSFHRFKLRHAVLGGFEGRQVVAFKNLAEFRERFASFAFEVAKADALDLPAETDVERRTELEPTAERTYRSLSKAFWAEVDAGEVTATNALAKLLRLQQVTSGTLPTDEGKLVRISTAKRKLLADVLTEIPLSEPVVVFARFRQDLEAIAEAAFEAGRAYGEISGRRKDALADDAHMRPDLDLVGVQIQSGGVGIDLTRARYAIFYSTGFNLGDYLQARARVHRPGQDRPVTYLHLLVEDTIDETVHRALRRRQEVVRAILEGVRT